MGLLFIEINFISNSDIEKWRHGKGVNRENDPIICFLKIGGSYRSFLDFLLKYYELNLSKQYNFLKKILFEISLKQINIKIWKVWQGVNDYFWFN